MPDDSILLLLRPRKKGRNIHKRQNRDPKTIAKPDEARHLIGRIIIDRSTKIHWLIRDDSDHMMIHHAKAGNRIRCKLPENFIKAVIEQQVVNDGMHIVSASGIIRDKLFKPHRCACLLRAMKHSGQPAVCLPRRLMQSIQLCLRFFAAVLRKIGQKHPDLIKAGLFILTYDMCHPALLSVYFAPTKLI